MAVTTEGRREAWVSLVTEPRPPHNATILQSFNYRRYIPTEMVAATELERAEAKVALAIEEA
jgi:hypothetical protein